MIHALPEPIEGQTHVQITKRTTYPDSGIVLHYRFGTLDAEGGFVPSRIAAEQKRSLPKPQARVIQERAAAAGAPVTAGTQEHRAADELAVMDAEGLW